jgi:recyclin-1
MLDPWKWGGDGEINGSIAREGYTRGIDATDVPWGDEDEDNLEVPNEQDDDAATPATASTSPQPSQSRTFDNLQLLLSLDVTFELIHAARETLKRVEIFVNYSGTYGVRVRETMEEVANELLGVLGERHVRGGFESWVVVLVSVGFISLDRVILGQ